MDILPSVTMKIPINPHDAPSHGAGEETLHIKKESRISVTWTRNAQRGRPTQQMDTHETTTNVKNNLLVLSRE